MPSTARTSPSSVGKWTCRSFTCRNGFLESATEVSWVTVSWVTGRAFRGLGSLAGAMSGKAHSRVDDAVEQVNHEVGYNNKQGRNEHESNNHRQVEHGDSVYCCTTHPLEVEHSLGNRRSGEQTAEVQTRDGDDRRQGRPQGVFEHHRALREALGACRAKEVFSHGLKHVGPGQPDVSGCIDTGQGQPRKQEPLEPGNRVFGDRGVVGLWEDLPLRRQIVVGQQRNEERGERVEDQRRADQRSVEPMTSPQRRNDAQANTEHDPENEGPQSDRRGYGEPLTDEVAHELCLQRRVTQARGGAVSDLVRVVLDEYRIVGVVPLVEQTTDELRILGRHRLVESKKMAVGRNRLCCAVLAAGQTSGIRGTSVEHTERDDADDE